MIVADIPLTPDPEWASLRELRLARGYVTFAALAEVVGCTPEAIAKWERHERSPKSDWIVALAKALYVEAGTVRRLCLADPLARRIEKEKGAVLSGSTVAARKRSPARPISEDEVLARLRRMGAAR